MIDYMIYLIAFLITVPMISTWLIYILGKKIVGHPLKALHMAVNWTTTLYILATLSMLMDIFEQSLVGIFLGIFIFILAIIIIVQWKIRTEVVLGRAIKILWRFCFLFFLLTYSILVVSGITIRVLF